MKIQKTKVTISATQLSAILMAGQQMSNICFNLAQRDSMPTDIRKSMKECQGAWDAAYPTIRNGKVVKV